MIMLSDAVHAIRVHSRWADSGWHQAVPNREGHVNWPNDVSDDGQC